MTDPSIRHPAYLSLTDQQLSEIDELCDRFDQDLVGGTGPRIEDFLVDAPESARGGLLAELLAMEFEYVRQQGDEPEPSGYVQRFPQQESVITNVFRAAATKPFSGNEKSSFSVDIPPHLEDFRLIEEIGCGGMGVVWLAEQIQPVNRRVAVKLIKSELTSQDVIARFDAEKQALAIMDHPNIAKILDAGSTIAGHPYFVMELVDGVAITQYCDDNKLSVDERLKLFVSVCKAVQHAHHKGIVHRDLKPSNVLVTVIDGEAIPKVIDFGLAKAIEQTLQLTDVTLQTEFGKVVGTVQYMSPEQAELKGVDAEDVDTRTDIYSLGVMLYELLTGSTPLDEETLGRNALLKILELIREEDPPRPSNRLSSSSNEVNSEVSDLRRLHPARLQQLLRGELDWVVMKALEKDRARRYQTANDLSRDVSNYLTGETVAARPPSTWYQIQKFANQNRGLVAAMLAICASLLAGSVGTGYGLIRANEKTKLAEDKSREANEERANAVEAEERANTESLRARDSEADAKFQLANARWDASRARDARDLLREIPSEYRDNFEWRYYNRKFEGSDFTCYGHSGSVADVAFSSDGTRIATASSDSSIKLWDANSGDELNTLRGHQGTVDLVVFSADGSRIASTGSDRVIKIWDARSGQAITNLKGHNNHIVAIEFGPDGKQLVSASQNATVKRWDVHSGQEVSTIEYDEDVSDVAFSRGGNRFVSCGDSGVILWDATTGQEIARQTDAVRWPQSVAFSPDGMHIAVAGWDLVTLLDGQLTQKLWTEIKRSGWIFDLSFSPDGTRIASTGDTDRQIQIWDVNSGIAAISLMGHGGTVRGVAFSPDGTRLASVGQDKTLRLWDARTGQKPMSIQAHSHRVLGVEFNDDGTRLASASLDGTFKLWDVQNALEIVSRPSFYNLESQAAHCVAFSPNGAYVTFSGSDNKVRLLDGRTGAELQSLQGHDGSICGVAFDPDSKRLVSGSFDRTVKLWDIESGEEIKTLRGLTGNVISVAFSPDGIHVAVCDDLSIKLWDTKSGRVVKSLDGHERSVFDVAFSPDGSRIASASNDTTIRIWDSHSGEEITQLRGHSAGVVGVAFSPDGTRIASTSFDSALKLWDAQTGLETMTIEASVPDQKNLAGSEAHSIQTAAFSPNGLRIAAGMDNGIIKFLNAPTEHEVETLSGHTDTVIHYSFSDDGSQIYSESKNETLFWDLATKKRVANATRDPPATHTHVSPDGRWQINGDRKNLLLIDLKYKNTPREKAYRAAKVRVDRQWHQEQAAAVVDSQNWYAATFHYGVLMQNDPDQPSLYDVLHSSFQELNSQFEQQEIDLELHLAMVVMKSLKLPRGNDLPNPSFEEPEIRKGSFEFRKTIPGWKTTGKMFEIWSAGFEGVKSHDGHQFVELNANEDGTLYKELAGIKQDSLLEFSFAHRGRNGDDTLKLTVTDLGADNALGGGDDQELFSKDYTTGMSTWVVYDSTAEPPIAALGNKLRFAYTAVHSTGGKGPDKTEGNFLDAAYFGVAVVTAK